MQFEGHSVGIHFRQNGSFRSLERCVIIIVPSTNVLCPAASEYRPVHPRSVYGREFEHNLLVASSGACLIHFIRAHRFGFSTAFLLRSNFKLSDSTRGRLRRNVSSDCPSCFAIGLLFTPYLDKTPRTAAVSPAFTRLCC